MERGNQEKSRESSNQLDMTPMVDVTFLLLIFFMVTASFVVQKAAPQNRLVEDLPGPVEIEKDKETKQIIEILVDRFNTFRLTSNDQEIEAPSDQELRVRLRDMLRENEIDQIRITAHGNAWHEKVVTAWDAGVDNRINDIVIRLTETDY